MNTTGQKRKFVTTVTPEFRLSYPSLFQAQVPPGKTERDAKFSITMLFAPGTDLSSLKKLAHDAAVEAWGANTKKWPTIKHPLFRKGDEPGKKDKPGYGKGVVFCKASSRLYNTKTGAKNMPPGVVGPDCKIIMDPSEVYGGCYCRAKVSAFVYNTQGNTGISFGLVSVQKLRDGEPFGSRPNPETDFDSIDAGSKAEDAAAEEPQEQEGNDPLGL